ncbi:MAG: peptidoglycan glycosyltransferase [Chthonomonadaceae bacterium]|nr:peptidoglycan glycosyltransferase [Chthonomonadaceae bacterium]
MIAPPDHIPDHRRLHAFYAMMVSLLAVIVVRLWYLQIVKGPELAAESEMRRTRTVRRLAARGSIEDTHGHVLATNRFRFVVSVLPFEIDKNPDVLPRLAKILHRTEADLNDQIDENTLTQFDPVPVADDVDVALLSQIEEQKFDLTGVVISRDPERYYTDNRMFTHVLGFTGRVTRQQITKLSAANYQNGDYIGTEGLEKTFESELRGKDGGQVIAVNAKGRTLANLDDIPPTPGHTLRLTLDYDLQKVALDALMEELSNTGHPGSAVAIDPNTGAVLALASAPSYDLNTYRKDIGKLLKDPQKPLINRAVNSPQPCGSTFKLVTAAAGLESGSITSEESIYCPGSLRLGNRTFHCDKRSGHGSLSLGDAIGQSCDVYFWRLAQRIGEESLEKMAHRFGLGETTDIDLPPTRAAKGLIPNAAWKQKTKRGPWMQGDLLNMSIGQGYVGVTTLQLANYTAALANGGTLWRPQLVREVRDVSGLQPRIVSILQPQQKGDLGLRPANRAAIVDGMRRALERRGTAAGIAIPGLAIAGKTGTAQVTKTEDNSVFVCFAPADHPKIAIAVLVEKGGHGSDVAAPIARRMLNQYLHLKLDNASVPIGHHVGID